MDDYIKCNVGDTLQINAYVNVGENINPDKVIFACKALDIEQELTHSINENGESMWTHTFSANDTATWNSGIYKVTFFVHIQNIVQSRFYYLYLYPNTNLTRQL